MTDASLNVLWLLTEQEVLLAKHLVSCRRIALQRTLCMTTESTTGWDVGGSLDGWMDLYMGVCMFMFGQVGRMPPCHSLPAAAQYRVHRSSHGPPSRASSPPHRSLAVQSSPSAATCSSVSTHVLVFSAESSQVGPGHGGNWTNTKI